MPRAAQALTLRDALPDSWGRKVLEVQQGSSLSDIDVEVVEAMTLSMARACGVTVPSFRLLPYVELTQVLRRRSWQPEVDLPELFRRMVFNLVVGNSDDHVKNHGVLNYGNGKWELAPAFDLVPQLVLAREAAPHCRLISRVMRLPGQ